MDNEGRLESGFSENLALALNIQRLRYVERNVYSAQLLVNREISRQHFLDLGMTVSGVARREPDRSEVVYENSTGTPAWYGFSNQAAVRTFGNLNEHAVEATGNWRARLGSSGNRFFHFGGLYRHASRDASNRAYSISLLHALSPSEQSLEPESLFDGRLTEGSDPNLHLIVLGAGGSYAAKENLAAGYGMLTLELTPNLEVVGGARVEHSAVDVRSLSSAGEPSIAKPTYTDVLPSLAFNYRPGSKVNLRLSGTQTLSRPEYRELSPILFREVIHGDNVKGNENLKRALIRNLDLRAEWYPRSGEVLSVALFAKWFHQPIERIYTGTSGERIITYVNAHGARNYGVELEARRSLDFVSPSLITLSVFANATLMHSRIDIDSTAGSVTNPERKMVGQAPYVLNGGITWRHPAADASATLLFNRVGERITEAGEVPLPDVVEKPRNMLDASITFPLFGTLGARVDGKNLLNSRFLQTQGGVIREGYWSGRVFSIGFSWRQ
jgi:TonB-dependent receptor